MRTIGVVTVGRSDYGIYMPLLRAIEAAPDLELRLIVGGMHLSPEFGLTVKQIEADGFLIEARVNMSLSSDSPVNIAKSIGLGVTGFAEVYAQFQPDILIVLGDRFEMYSATVAALPFRIPVAHIHGGELTFGAIDDAFRHSMTKLSHIHFASIEEYRRRIVQMGEEPWRVHVSGALSLDNLNLIELMDRKKFSQEFDINLPERFLLVTYHPVTLEYEETEWQINELLATLDAYETPVLFTMPNADTGGRIIRDKVNRYVEQHNGSFSIENVGAQGYFSLMSLAIAMVGNSSSGIIEAPSFKLPVVNIGTRQKGRLCSDNVIGTGYQNDEILTSLKRASSDDFREEIKALVNPYGNGRAASVILETLRNIRLGRSLLMKEFHEIC